MTRSLAIIFKIGKVRAFGYAFGKHCGYNNGKTKILVIMIMENHYFYNGYIMVIIVVM